MLHTPAAATSAIAHSPVRWAPFFALVRHSGRRHAHLTGRPRQRGARPQLAQSPFITQSRRTLSTSAAKPPSSTDAASSPAAPVTHIKLAIANESSQSEQHSPAELLAAADATPSTTSRVFDVILGVAFGMTLYKGLEWLLDWPQPLPVLQTLINDDKFLAETIGSPIKLSWLWTGNVHPQSSFSVALPVSGPLNSGIVYARGVYDSASKDYKLVYLQASIAPLQQKHSLDIPPHLAISQAPPSPAHSALVMPANFDPTLLSKDQFVKYQEFLFKHGLREWRPEPLQKPAADTYAATSEQSSSTPAPASDTK